MKNIIRSLLILSGIVFTGSVILLSCKGKETKNSTDADTYSEYIGREKCQECHEMQHDLYQHSDHDEAMDIASESTVLGDFNDTEFTHFDISSKFYRKADSAYYVYTEGPEGVMQEFKIDYVFGVRPLQQYLIAFPNGAYQCLPLAWDTRAESKGGQRWFHLYGNEHIPHDDILFWTRATQNWNYMCAECHSTNLRKNYDYETKTYHTVWNEIDVSCESCHGPGSAHAKWAQLVEEGASPDIYDNMGLEVRLKDTDNATWVFEAGESSASRSVARGNDDLVQMCARCHSRRAIVTEEYYHGGSLLETHWPSLLDEGLYFADGQIQDEVYVYGSFLQSKMYMEGVNCKDCHEPHSGKVYVNGNALCYRCHLASDYAGREHHFHDPAGEGASCMECHMHERTYMVVDPRRDHSIRIPRPDLSDKLGTPNSCVQCHDDKTNAWATKYLKEWYGQDLLDTPHYGEAFWAGRRSYPEALPQLIQVIHDSSSAPMVRATATSLLANYNDASVLQTCLGLLHDKDPLIRYSSLSVLQNVQENAVMNAIIETLDDNVKLVRIMAANALSHFDVSQLPEKKKALYEQAMAEYLESLEINSDHPGTHVNYGNLHLNQGDHLNAEKSYKEAIAIEPGLITAYINLADLYRRQQRDKEGEVLLHSALEKYPELAAVNYALGLLKIRTGNSDDAMQYLKAAAEYAPNVARYSYVYAIGLNSSNRAAEAILFLEASLKEHPFDRDILLTLTTLNIEQGDKKTARKYALRLVETYPMQAEYQQILQMTE